MTPEMNTSYPDIRTKASHAKTSPHGATNSCVVGSPDKFVTVATCPVTALIRTLGYWFSARKSIGCGTKQKHEPTSSFITSRYRVCFIHYRRANVAIEATISRQTDTFDESSAGRRECAVLARHWI